MPDSMSGEHTARPDGADTEPVAAERVRLRQEVHDIIRTTTLGRGAVLTSEPDEIVEMTARAIAERIVLWSSNELDDLAWYPRAATLGRDICRRLDASKLSPTALATAKRIVTEVAQ